MRLIDADEIRIKPDFIFHGVCGTPVIRCEDLARIINDMPTIEPQKWIPVSESLPEIGEYVLCSQDNGDVGEGILLYSGSWLICYDQSCHRPYWVNAWMPLPEPWGGDSDE